MTGPLAEDFVDLLRCPRCVHDDQGPSDPKERGRLKLGAEDNAWLICQQCGLQYAVTDGIPNLLQSEAHPPEGRPDPRA